VLTETAVAFSSQGATLRGYLVTLAGGRARRPAVMMAHGTSATLRMAALDYARVFARAGLAALVFDHRNFGCSDGEPRLEINPWIQCRGYVDALTFASTHPAVDPDRMALWGDSYSGGEVVVVSACDARAKAVVAQCPIFGAALPPQLPSADAFAAIKATLLTGDVAGTPETSTGPLPVVSHDQAGTPSLLTPIQAFRWFIEYGGRPGSGWVNRVTRVIPSTPAVYSPYLCSPFVQADVLLMVAPDDEMVHANYAVAQQAFALMPGVTQWYDIADGHFGLLHCPGARFDEAASVKSKFLRDRLTGLTPPGSQADAGR
jgi:hypothetical protein